MHHVLVCHDKIVKLHKYLCLNIIENVQHGSIEKNIGYDTVGRNQVILQLGHPPSIDVYVGQSTVSLGQSTKSVQPTFINVY